MKQTKLGPKGQQQAAVVMKTFKDGKLRSSSGKTVTDPEQARAIAMSEGRAAEERGTEKREWRGRERIRPKKVRR